MIKTLSRNILNLFVCVFMLSIVVGCAKPMTYEQVQEAEKYCIDRGMTPVHSTWGEGVIIFSCQDKQGNSFPVPEKQQTK